MKKIHINIDLFLDIWIISKQFCIFFSREILASDDIIDDELPDEEVEEMRRKYYSKGLGIQKEQISVS